MVVYGHQAPGQVVTVAVGVAVAGAVGAEGAVGVGVVIRFELCHPKGTETMLCFGQVRIL